MLGRRDLRMEVQMNDAKPPGDGWTGFLTDVDLREAVNKGWITSCHADARSSWQGADSQIQPSSIDLYAEGFFTPESPDQAKTSLSLPAGGAVVYYTKEKLNLPRDVMGFVFTPTQWSMVGFFSPSIGHIDPGFKGALRQVGINMGQKELHLHSDMKVATVLLYKLHSPSDKDHTDRNGRATLDAAVNKAREIAPRFASDFGNFREQAKEVAMKEVEKSRRESEEKVDAKLTTAQAAVDTKLSDVQKTWWLPLAAALVLIPIVQIISSQLVGLDDLKQRLAKLEGAVNAKTSPPVGPVPQK
jgi:deoxycytidine triphosphate deaminase